MDGPMSITSQESHNMNNDHLTHWDVIAQSQPIIAKLCHKNYKQGSISLAHQGRSTIFLDSIIQCLHRLKGILNNYEVVYDNDVFQYNAAFYDKWMRLSDFNDRDDAIEFVKKMDAKIVVAIADILNIVSAKNIHTKTSGLGHTVRNGEVMPNHYYSSRSDGMEVSLHYISLCIHKYISVLTQSERKFFIQHIQVDFDKGEKPVYFGGCFQTDGVSGIVSDGSGNYCADDNCKWILNTNVTGDEIVVQRKNSSVFDVAPADSVNISDTDGVLKEFWRPGFDENITISTGYVKIEFNSDESDEREGFELEWYSCGPLCPTVYDASRFTNAFNKDRNKFGCIEFVST